MSDDQAMTAPGNRTRRALLAGAGAVGASVVLAACGTDKSNDSSSGGSGNPAPTSGGATGAPSGGAERGGSATLAKTSEIPVGGGKVLSAQGIVVTQPTAGQFKGFSNICTHQGCPVSSVDGGTINCTCHGSHFSITDGSVKGGPATKPLPAKNVKVSGDSVTLA
jgi:Rieske Fe-S protein